jgi:hypothetical protein
MPRQSCPLAYVNSSALLKVCLTCEAVQKITLPAFDQLLRDLSQQHCAGGH